MLTAALHSRRSGAVLPGGSDRGHVKVADAVLDPLVSEVQSTPLSAAFITRREGLGPGNVGIKASSRLLSSTLRCSSLGHTCESGVKPKIPVGGRAMWQMQYY